VKSSASSEAPILSAAAERAIRVLPSTELVRVKSFFDVVRNPDSSFEPVEIEGSGLYVADISGLGALELSSNPMYVRFGDERRRKTGERERPLVVVYRTPLEEGSPRLVVERIVRDSLEEVLKNERAEEAETS
jgi:hypothetical protein